MTTGIVRQPTDLLSGLVFVLIGASAMLVALGYPLGTLNAMGPGYFPALVGGLLCCVGAILVGKSFFGETEEAMSFAVWPLIIVLVGLTAFAIVLLGGGLAIAVVILVLVVRVAAGHFRVLPSALLAVGLAVTCIAMFVIGLGQPLPIFGPWLHWPLG